jgi:hypothetical protein
MATPEQKQKYAHYVNGSAAVSTIIAAVGALAHTPYVSVAFGSVAGVAWAGGVALGRMADKEIQARRDPARVSPDDVDLERDAPARGRSRERDAVPARDAGVEMRPMSAADVGGQTEPPALESSERDANFERVKSAVTAYNIETFENELRRPALSPPSGPQDVQPWSGERRTDGTLLPLDERGEQHAVSLGRGKYEVVAARDLERFSQLRGQGREHSPQRQPSPQRGH